ncbi:MAG: hypothetical protein CSA20_00125 [Deltaproteobacteria bacterium]|nr:MAG: hypothetical protein CSA20_00125 [Deltaproteobacteria bacterium]
MFRITDIITLAVQIEKNGEQAYRKAASQVKDKNIKEMLLWMAAEEQRHRKWFEQLGETDKTVPDDPELEAMGQRMLEEMVSKEPFSLEQKTLSEAQNVAELLEQSRGFEQDTALFYEFLSGLLDDPLAISQIEAIIAEEQHHAAQLDQLIKTLKSNAKDEPGTSTPP